MNARSINACVVAVCAVLVGAVLSVLMPEAPAHAYGGGVSHLSAPRFNGGTITTGLTISGVTNDIVTPGSEDLTLAPGGALIVTPSGVSSGRGLKVDATSTAVRLSNPSSVNLGAVTFSGVGDSRIGSQSDKAIGTHIGCFADGLTSANAGNDLFCVDGVGIAQMVIGVSASNNLSGTSACAASGDVGKLVLYSDTSTNKTTFCGCEQTGSAAFAWGALTGAGDCT